MINLRFILFLTYLALVSCAPKIQTEIDKKMPALSVDKDVVVFGLKYTPQDNAVAIGKIKSGGQMHIGTYTTSNTYDYSDVISKLRSKARKSGSNIIKVNELKYPGFSSKSIRIKGELYYAENVKEVVEDYYESNIWSPHDKEAMIYFMRPYMHPGSGLAAKIYSENENHINNVYAGFVYHHSIKKSGEYSFYIESNEEMKVNLNVEMGNEYYVLIGFNQGWFKTGFLIEDVTEKHSHYENKAQVIELIPKHPKQVR